MSDPPSTNNPGIPPGRPGVDPGQSFAVVAWNGHVQMGGAGHGTVVPVWKGASTALNFVKFSTFNMLSGGEASCDELPIQIISDIPFDHYCAYDIPADTTRYEWFLSNVNMETADPCLAMLNSRSNIGIIGVCSAEDLAILEAKTIMVKGKPVKHKWIIAHKDSLVYVNIAGLSAMPMVTLTKEIRNALSFYGTIVDIEFEQMAGCLATKACALIDANAAIILGHIAVKGRRWTLSGKTINPVCSYCKEAGHCLDNCEKKLRQEQSMPAHTCPVAQINAAMLNTAASRNTSGGRAATGNCTAPSGGNSTAGGADITSPPPKRPKRNSKKCKQSTAEPSAPTPEGDRTLADMPTSDSNATPVTPTPSFITSFISNSSLPQSVLLAQPPMHDGMVITISLSKAPPQLATSGHVQPEGANARKGARSNTLPISMMGPLELQTSTQEVLDVNNNQGMSYTATMQGNGQMSLGIACVPPNADGEDAPMLHMDATMAAAEHGVDSVLMETTQLAVGNVSSQPTQPNHNANVRAVVHTFQSENGSERLLVEEVSLGGGGLGSE
ncbi:hypothetical protein FBU31_004211 [Coemansia sp. 'formosensis']|nr:hypothetical protein FBU31_004211 [Coemansia sp. 'formosensis']